MKNSDKDFIQRYYSFFTEDYVKQIEIVFNLAVGFIASVSLNILLLIVVLVQWWER